MSTTKSALTACWAEACRVLKDGGLLAFTFHHSEDAQWAIVLESLFEAGFILEQTFPIASDEQKGEGGQFGAKGTEYDIIHVCRKRLAATDLGQLGEDAAMGQDRVKPPQTAAWPPTKPTNSPTPTFASSFGAKRLSFTAVTMAKSSHPMTNHSPFVTRLAESTNCSTRTPESVPAIRRRSFSRSHISTCGSLLLNHRRAADDVSKSLFGTTIRQRDFEDRGLVEERNRVVTAVPIQQRFEEFRRRPRKEMKTEIDQAHFLIGAAMTQQWRQSGTGAVEGHLDGPPKRRCRPGVVCQDGSRTTRFEQQRHLARTILRQTLEKLRQQPAELGAAA